MQRMVQAARCNSVARMCHNRCFGCRWSDCNHVVAIEFELGGDWMHDFQQVPNILVMATTQHISYGNDPTY